jgi:small subunit ribosomal protein S19
MARSLKKGYYCDEGLLEKVKKAKESGSDAPVKTWSRSSTILPEFVGVKFGVHNGKKFVEVFVTEDMVGHKLGEFATTTTFKGHGGKKAK